MIFMIKESYNSTCLISSAPSQIAVSYTHLAVKVIPESKYIYIAGERLKLTSIKSYLVYSEEVPADSRIDKENTVLSVGILMNNIKPKSAAKPDEMRTLKKLAITTFQGETLIFSEDEIDVDATVKLLKV